MIFPKDYVCPGDEGLKLGIPWMVPDAVKLLHNICRGYQPGPALEIGSGASTVFFNNFFWLTSFDFSKEWADKVNTRLKDSINRFNGVTVCDSIDDIKVALEKTTLDTYRVLIVDPQEGINRDDILVLCQPFMYTEHCIVLDNWAAKELFPITWNMSHNQLLDYLKLDKTESVVLDFHDPNWWGKGTRIVLGTKLEN